MRQMNNSSINPLDVAKALYPTFADGEKAPSFVAAALTVEAVMDRCGLPMAHAWQVTRTAMEQIFRGEE